MKVLVDGRNLSLKTGTGVATYARNVCQVLSDAGHHVDVLYGEAFGYHPNPIFRDLSFFDAVHPNRSQLKRDLSTVLSTMRDARPFHIPLEGTVISRQFANRIPPASGYWNASDLFYNADTAYALPYRLRRRFNRVSNLTGSAIAHWTYPLPLHLKGAANIYTIHDLVPLRLPFTTLDRKRAYFRMIAEICRTADAIVTVSEHSRKDVLNLFDVDPGKVVNTYQSVEIPRKLLDTDLATLTNELKGAYDLAPREYILFYGAIEPKKNLGRLIEAYQASGITYPLMVVGKDGWLYGDDPSLKPLFKSAPDEQVSKTRPRRPRIRRLDYVSFPQLINLIRGARMVALPSLYEGFGLPIIEAMICGTPVLTSHDGAMAEVAGEAALLVDPYDVRSIRDGLVALCGNDERRQQLVQAGQRRILEFAPQRHAQRLAPVYESVSRRSRERLVGNS